MEVELYILGKTVFLDRDGIINRCAAPHQYITEWNDFVFLPGVEGALSKLKKEGYQLILISNQRGIARGMLSWEQLSHIHELMQKHLALKNAELDGIYVCPHDNEECHCRKPEIGLFLQAECDFLIDKTQSWMVGDMQTDVEAGKKYGVRTILTNSLTDAVNEILLNDFSREKGTHDI